MYVPILKGKQSEGLAVQHLHAAARDQILPLIDLAAPSTDKQKQAPSQHVDRSVRALTRHYESVARVLLDSSEMPIGLNASDGTHPLLKAARELSAGGIKVLPVTGLYRDKQHQDAVNNVVAECGASVIGVRLDPYDLETPSDTAAQLSALQGLRFPGSQFVLIYDLQNIHGADIDALASRVKKLDDRLDHTDEVLAVVAGSGMPDKISTIVPVKSSAYIARIEADVWRRVRSQVSADRRVVFGDYATVTPNYVELDWRIIYKMIGPKIIYAQSGDWFVIRGGSFENHPDGRDQYFDLAREVTMLADYAGKDYSFGDRFIHEKSQRVGSAGSPGQWVQASINRHVTLTATEMMPF